MGLDLILLGTGAAVPSRRRGLSSTAVARLGEIVLFDCGEGTQLRLADAGLRSGRVRSILFSHLHGDHLYGVFGLLNTYEMAERERPLDLVGPRGLGRLIDTLCTVTRARLTYPIRLRELDDGYVGPVIERDGYRIEAAPLRHTVPTFGYRFREHPLPGRFHPDRARALGIEKGPDWGRLQRGAVVTAADGRVVRPRDVLGPPRPGLTVVYCLDTRYCDEAVELARGADVLVHEATFTEEHAEEATRKGHSTAREAAEVARRAGVGRLVLTHVSARYRPEDDARMLAEARAVFPDSVLAADRMRLTVERPDAAVGRPEG